MIDANKWNSITDEAYRGSLENFDKEIEVQLGVYIRRLQSQFPEFKNNQALLDFVEYACKRCANNAAALRVCRYDDLLFNVFKHYNLEDGPVSVPETEDQI